MADMPMEIAALKQSLQIFGDRQKKWKTSETDANRKLMEDAAADVFDELKKDFSYVSYVRQGDLLNVEYVQQLQLAIRHYAWQRAD